MAWRYPRHNSRAPLAPRTATKRPSFRRFFSMARRCRRCRGPSVGGHAFQRGWREFMGWKLRSYAVCGFFPTFVFFFPARWWMTVEGCYKWHLRHGIVSCWGLLGKKKCWELWKQIPTEHLYHFNSFLGSIRAKRWYAEHVLHQTNSDVFPLVLDLFHQKRCKYDYPVALWLSAKSQKVFRALSEYVWFDLPSFYLLVFSYLVRISKDTNQHAVKTRVVQWMSLTSLSIKRAANKHSLNNEN